MLSSLQKAVATHTQSYEHSLKSIKMFGLADARTRTHIHESILQFRLVYL